MTSLSVTLDVLPFSLLSKYQARPALSPQTKVIAEFEELFPTFEPMLMLFPCVLRHEWIRYHYMSKETCDGQEIHSLDRRHRTSNNCQDLQLPVACLIWTGSLASINYQSSLRLTECSKIHVKLLLINVLPTLQDIILTAIYLLDTHSHFWCFLTSCHSRRLTWCFYLL